MFSDGLSVKPKSYVVCLQLLSDLKRKFCTYFIYRICSGLQSLRLWHLLWDSLKSKPIFAFEGNPWRSLLLPQHLFTATATRKNVLADGNCCCKKICVCSWSVNRSCSATEHSCWNVRLLGSGHQILFEFWQICPCSLLRYGLLAQGNTTQGGLYIDRDQLIVARGHFPPACTWMAIFTTFFCTAYSERTRDISMLVKRSYS